MSRTPPWLRARDAWDRYWFGDASLVQLGVFRMIVMAAAFDLVWRYKGIVLRYVEEGGAGIADHRWDPILLLDVLRVGPPSHAAAQTIFVTLLVAIACGFLGIFTRAACAVVAVLATYWASIHYSFNKPHHDAIQLTLTLWVLPFTPAGDRLSLTSLARRLRRAHAGLDPVAAPETAPWAQLAIRVTQVSAALGYFFAGATKVYNSGLGWANGYTLQGIMLEYRAPWSDVLAQHVVVCQLMQVGLLFVQVSFPLILLDARLRWFYLPSAVAFHLVAMKTMSTGTFATLWLPVVAAFVPWARVPDFLRSCAQRVGRPAALAGLGAALFGLSYPARFYLAQKPEWLGLLIVPAVVTVVFIVAQREPLAVRYDRDSTASRRSAALLAASDWSSALRIEAGSGPATELEAGDSRRGAAWRRAVLRTPLGPLLALLPRR